MLVKDGPLDGDCVDLTTPPKFTDAPLVVFGGLKRFNFCGFGSGPSLLVFEL